MQNSLLIGLGLYNLRDGSEEIEGIGVKKELKYLGVEFLNERNMFKGSDKDKNRKGTETSQCNM